MLKEFYLGNLWCRMSTAKKHQYDDQTERFDRVERKGVFLTK